MAKRECPRPDLMPLGSARRAWDGCCQKPDGCHTVLPDAGLVSSAVPPRQRAYGSVPSHRIKHRLARSDHPQTLDKESGEGIERTDARHAADMLNPSRHRRGIYDLIFDFNYASEKNATLRKV
jgi:hypothetical protein